jgi:hypothetical protein
MIRINDATFKNTVTDEQPNLSYQRLITYHVSYLVFFSVISFVFVLSILVAIGCVISDHMCTDPQKSTLSEIVDQPEIYQWFSVLTTINVIVLFYAMFHYIDPIRVKPGKELLSYRISILVLFLQSIGSILFLVVILLPITLHPHTHIVVVQIAFGFILAVHIAMLCRTFFCVTEKWWNLIISFQCIHLFIIFVLAGAYLLTENGFIEIAFILITILYYLFLTIEYWNVSVTLIVNNHTVAVETNSKKLSAKFLTSRKSNIFPIVKRRYYPSK